MNYHVGQRVRVKSNDNPASQEEYYAVINRITNRGNIFVDKLKSDKSGIEARGIRIKEHKSWSISASIRSNVKVPKAWATIYEWRFEQTEDGNVVDVCHNESNSLNGLLMGELEDYGSNNRDNLEPYWEICLVNDYFYLQLVDGKFQLIYQINIFLMKYPSVLKHR